MQYLLSTGEEAKETLASHYLLRTSLHYVEGLAKLLAAGMDANMNMGRDTSPLCLAAGQGLSRAVELLLQYGADPFKEDNEGRTARAYAFDQDGRHREHYDRCEALLTEAMERITRP